MRGTLKNKLGSPIWPETVASAVTVQMDNEQYSLDAVLAALDTDPVEHYSASRSNDIAGGTSYTVPQYTVGASHISVYLDGLKCAPGTDFHEAGTEGQPSTSITFTDIVDKTTSILVRVGR